MWQTNFDKGSNTLQILHQLEIGLLTIVIVILDQIAYLVYQIQVPSIILVDLLQCSTSNGQEYATLKYQFS